MQGFLKRTIPLRFLRSFTSSIPSQKIPGKPGVEHYSSDDLEGNKLYKVVFASIYLSHVDNQVKKLKRVLRRAEDSRVSDVYGDVVDEVLVLKERMNKLEEVFGRDVE